VIDFVIFRHLTQSGQSLLDYVDRARNTVRRTDGIKTRSGGEFFCNVSSRIRRLVAPAVRRTYRAYTASVARCIRHTCGRSVKSLMQSGIASSVQF